MKKASELINKLKIRTCCECGQRIRRPNTNVCMECLEKTLRDSQRPTDRKIYDVPEKHQKR